MHIRTHIGASDKCDISNEGEIMNYSISHAGTISYLCGEIIDCAKINSRNIKS
jgi:hypothetical protein